MNERLRMVLLFLLSIAVAIVLYAIIAFLFTTFNVPGADCFGVVGNETERQFCENLTRG